eukprot:m.118497 g.118497  ORF g.118497 m.118497 type:complete len:63 (+) comp13656_c0_seq2:106-294(+)
MFVCVRYHYDLSALATHPSADTGDALFATIVYVVETLSRVDRLHHDNVPLGLLEASFHEVSR